MQNKIKLGVKDFFNTFIQQGCIESIKSDCKDTFIMLQKISISNKYCSFAISIEQ